MAPHEDAGDVERHHVAGELVPAAQQHHHRPETRDEHRAADEEREQHLAPRHQRTGGGHEQHRRHAFHVPAVDHVVDAVAVRHLECRRAERGEHGDERHPRDAPFDAPAQQQPQRAEGHQPVRGDGQVPELPERRLRRAPQQADVEEAVEHVAFDAGRRGGVDGVQQEVVDEARGQEQARRRHHTHGIAAQHQEHEGDGDDAEPARVDRVERRAGDGDTGARQWRRATYARVGGEHEQHERELPQRLAPLVAAEQQHGGLGGGDQGGARRESRR